MSQGAPKKVALLATEVRRHSHAQHFIDRLLEGYGWHGEHYFPQLKLVSLYVDQFPENDLARDRAAPRSPHLWKHCRGTHPGNESTRCRRGDHHCRTWAIPHQRQGTKTIPSLSFLQGDGGGVRESGRAYSVFNDKHYSTRWEECVEMVEDSHRLASPPGRIIPAGHGAFLHRHAVEQRSEGKRASAFATEESIRMTFTGWKPLNACRSDVMEAKREFDRYIAMRGKKVWDQLASRATTEQLLIAALNRSHQCRPPSGDPWRPPSAEWIQEACPNPLAYWIEHQDGFRTTLFMLNGLVQDFTYAGMHADGSILSCLMHLPMPPAHTTTADFSIRFPGALKRPSPLNMRPIHLSALADFRDHPFCCRIALSRRGCLEHPELNIRYQVGPRSSYWRG